MRRGSLHALLAKYEVVQYVNSNNPKKENGQESLDGFPALAYCFYFKKIVNTFRIMLICYCK